MECFKSDHSKGFKVNHKPIQSAVSIVSMCLYHPETPFSSWCSTCSFPICSACKQHQGHLQITLNQEKAKKEAYQTLMNRVLKKSSDFEEAKISLKKRQDLFASEIAQHSESWLPIFDQMKSELEETVVKSLIRLEINTENASKIADNLKAETDQLVAAARMDEKKWETCVKV
jgi:hypothetical protein